MKNDVVPKHIAIICDGNRRWAKARNLPSFEGHRQGFETIQKLSRKAKALGVSIITFWVFSTENWKRATEEVGYLMKLAEKVIDVQKKEAIQEKTRIIHIGRKDRIPEALRKKIAQAEEETKQFTNYYFVVALDYGGRDDIERAIKKMVQSSQTGSEQKPLDAYLDTAVLPQPDPDLIIRTSGEKRMSGFMAWQGAYSEYYFTDLHFPDFSPTELEAAVLDYGLRKRRFGA